ncbi:MAG TPA: ribonuclease HI family protein, partial [Candidatus Paceibacterota bacterium]|nr:ribonuclease HI family protein [Candidatus Paceibacterota bacterium]
MKLVIYADGGCEGNPGPSRCGVVALREDGSVAWELSKKLGYGTNNTAEWHALIAALKYAANDACRDVTVRMDSRLVVEQANGRWKIKNAGLKPLAAEAMALKRSLLDTGCTVSIEWVPREQNALA